MQMQNPFAQPNFVQQRNPSFMRMIATCARQPRVRENFDYTARKRQDSETLYRAWTYLRSPRNRASGKLCAAKIPHHWTQKNTFEYEVQLFSLPTICRSKHSTCHGSPTCLPFPVKLDPVSLREHGSQFFGPSYIEDAKGQIGNSTASSSLA